MNRETYVWIGVISVTVFLNLIPVAGTLRALPIPTGEGGTVPLGAFFPETPIYTVDIYDGEVIDQMLWATDRYLAGENVYDFKEWYKGNWFTYMPITLFLALTIKPFQPLQYYPWLLVMLVSLGTTAVLANKILKQKRIRKRERAVAIGLILIGQSIVRNIGWGHLFIIVLALLLTTYYYLDTHEFRAGLASGILNSILPYGYVLFPYFILKKKWKATFLSVVIPVLPVATLYLTNKPSFYGFFPFIVSSIGLGLDRVGSFSIIRVVEGTSLKYAYLGIHATIFFLFTLGLWYSKAQKRNIITDDLYFAFIPVFLLMTEPWFSGHHIMLAIVTYILLYSRIMILPYLLTELNYQTLFGQRVIGMSVAYTYPMFFGVILAYSIVVYYAYMRWKTINQQHSNLR